MQKLALITGATSGIGQEYAIQLAHRGYNLIITGRRKNLLEKVGRSLQVAYKVNVTVCVVDFTDSKAFEAFVAFVESLESVDFLVNNAGYGLENAFTKCAYETNEEMIKVHLLATTKLCHVVAKKMKTNQSGYIVNVSSLAGFITLPNSAMYCATKAYLINFSGSLALELQNDCIKVQALCPGFTHTDFHSKLALPKAKLKSTGIIRWMSAQDVVQASLDALNKNLQVIVVPGICNKILYTLNHLLPKKLYYKGALIGHKYRNA